MDTITIKLPKEQAIQLNAFIRERHLPSKSEFIRQLIIEKMETRFKEKQGWMALAEKSMEKIWKNKRDDEVWSKYL